MIVKLYTFKWVNGFWNTMSVEHKLAKDGKFAANKDVYFAAAGELRFVPHAALTNSELGSLDVIKTLTIGTMVKRNNFVLGSSDYDARNNWSKAHHTEGAQSIDGVVDVIRKKLNHVIVHKDLKLHIHVVVVQDQQLYY